MSKIKLNIITPERTLFSEEVEQVTIFTTQGEITILPGHLPVITTLKSGELRFIKNQKITPIIIHGGFAEIKDFEVNILADAAEKIEEIIEERAIEAKKNAEKMLSQKITDKKEYASLMAKLERDLARIRIAKKYKKTRNP